MVDKIIEVPQEYRPQISFSYPSDNHSIFEDWFSKNVKEEEISGRVYLPILFTSFFVNKKHGKDTTAIGRLQDFIDKLDNTKKYFTICQYDDGILVDLSGLDILVFNMAKNDGYTIPLLCPPHSYDKVNTDKINTRNIFANFIGSNTHPLRLPILSIKDRNYYISDKFHNLDDYSSILSRSIFTLCPRGYGATSFRICEALQYGSIPVYISDEFIIPHKDRIEFTDFGVLIDSQDVNNIDEILSDISIKEILQKQKACRKIYLEYFTYESNKKIILEEIKKPRKPNTMLISLSSFSQKQNIKLKGVIHVGAHYAQEHEEYIACGIKKFVYIEPCKEAFNKLQERFKDNTDVLLFNCACGEFTGFQEMNISIQNEGQSNSLLVPKKHLEEHPEIKFTEKEIVEVRRLDDLPINPSDYDLLMMDTQGFEGYVLKGAKEIIHHMNVVYTEVNRDDVYDGLSLIEEVDDLLNDFIRTKTAWAGNLSWGDAIYLKSSTIDLIELKEDEYNNPEGNIMVHSWMEYCRINKASRKNGVFLGADCNMTLLLPDGEATINDNNKNLLLVNRQGERHISKRQFELMKDAFFGNC